MDTPTLQVSLQAVSSTAFVCSVIYAGIQLRNWRRAQQVANFIKLVEMQMQLRKIRVDHPELARVHTHDAEGLESPVDIQHYFLNLMQLSVFEIAWFSHRMGQLSTDNYRSWEGRMRAVESEPSFRRMWNKPSMKILHDDFAAYMERMMRETAPPAPDGRTPPDRAS